MSISLAGIVIGLPIALTMRAVMGKEKFDSWIESMDYNLCTDFHDMEEVIRCVKAAGYDAVWYGNRLKTHLTESKNSYFFWSQKNGMIIAEMSVYDDKNAIHRFVTSVEQVGGRKMFWEEVKNKEIVRKRVESMTNVEGKNEALSTDVKYRETFPSIYMDAQLITDIMQQNNLKVNYFDTNRIEAEFEGYTMTFERISEEHPFDIYVESDTKKMQALKDCIEILNGDYYASVQEQAYIRVKDQLEEEGLEVENEEVLENNTIVLTVAV